MPEVPSPALTGRTPAEQVEALFRAVVAALESAGLLPARPGLTHRGIAAAPALPEHHRHTVGTISRAAERAVYGSWEPAPEDVEPYRDSAHRLLQDLEGGRR